MANRIVSVHAGISGIGIYAIMLTSSGFSVAHCTGVVSTWIRSVCNHHRIVEKHLISLLWITLVIYLFCLDHDIEVTSSTEVVTLFYSFPTS